MTLIKVIKIFSIG